MPIDLSAKKICFFVAERLSAGMCHLLQYPVVWYYVLQHLQYAKPRIKAFSKHYTNARARAHTHTHTHTHSHTLVCCTFNSRLTRRLWLPGTSQISDCLSIRIRVASIFLLTDATCVDKFFTPLRDANRGCRTLFQFSSEFSPKSHQKFQFGLAASQSDVCALKVARVPITYYKCVGGGTSEFIFTMTWD